jgi:hypothetical protein
MCAVNAAMYFAIFGLYATKAMSNAKDPFYVVAAPVWGLGSVTWGILARRALRLRAQSRNLPALPFS